uniref:Uncharacterized protein n=1 Tax=Heterorhabditis bacteriophora TaxID=37862 RepID=A0A1I7XRX4_HETBA
MDCSVQQLSRQRRAVDIAAAQCEWYSYGFSFQLAPSIDRLLYGTKTAANREIARNLATNYYGDFKHSIFSKST